MLCLCYGWKVGYILGFVVHVCATGLSIAASNLTRWHLSHL